MSDDDQSTRQALWAIGIIVTAVVVGTLWFAAAGGHRAGGATAAAVHAPTHAPSEGSSDVPAADIQSVSAVYFAVGQSAVPAEAAAALAQLVQAAAAAPSAQVVLSGYHDASGQAQRNAELAKQRALAVREALIQAGLSPERIRLQKPQMLVGGSDPEQARRVDMGLVGTH